MQAVILAAGMGNRLGKYTKNNTKCMLDINGKTLIERALDALAANKIKKCIIVVGYQKENLMDFVGTEYQGMEIIYVSNDVYNKTNNIYSLFLAKDFLLQDDTILLESDLIFESRVIADLLADTETSLAVVDKFESWMDGTVVQISDDKTITQFLPKKFFNYDDRNTYYKTVNIYKFSRDFLCQSYVPFLEAYSKAMGNNEYYEQVLRVITTLDKNELKAFCLDGHKWYEIDDIQDKDIAENIFAKDDDDNLERTQRRFGGYWRFPHMIDFCYLVNPYFPTPQMLNEMKAYFHDLLADYPSGLNVQNLLAGKMFGIDDHNILVGNGAAELIRALSGVLSGSVGVIYPTFNEYPESLVHNTIVPFIPEGMKYGLAELLLWSRECDNLLLINPDNPSGNCLPKADILTLLETMKPFGKKLVLDESFVDFASDGLQCTLLEQEIVDRYPNLIIIKSISKSYGVPGIRLGVLASSDEALIKKARGSLSIWNINSFGEYFLQIIGKYKKDYQEACKKIIAERERFRNDLESVEFLAVYPSQANYFMCECKGCTARELTKYLLGTHDIFIKDLTGKKGIVGGGWIRVAVRNKTDNSKLVEKLKLFPGKRS
jgi:histidinol-phosphate/aromatic aminotransferase/cobyric acid decarboxylase-like protein/choline kinase